jgi:hypothetical protein
VRAGVGHHNRASQSGCVDCLNIYYSKNDPRFVQQFRGFVDSRFSGPNIAFAPHIVRLSGMIASEAVRLLTGYTPPHSIGKQVEFEFESGAISTLTCWPRYERECPTCGSGRERDWPIFALYPGAVSRQRWQAHLVPAISALTPASRVRLCPSCCAVAARERW